MLRSAAAARPSRAVVPCTSLSCASAMQRHCCRRLVSSVSKKAACSGGPSAAAQCEAAQQLQEQQPQRYAVVGAGLAGLATAYHLVVRLDTKLSPPGRPVHITLVDAVGLGAGGSGAAAGLLHPYAPTGKLLWRAHEAMAAAVELLEAAEAAQAAGAGSTAAAPPQQIAWRTGMLRPAANLKQSQAYWKRQQQAVAAGGAGTTARLQAMLAAAAADADTAQQLLPGVQLPVLAIQQQQQQQQQQARDADQQQQQAGGSSGAVKVRKRQHPATPPGWTPAAAAALHIPGGTTLQPLQYLHALWAACQAAAAARGDGSSAVLQIQQLRSLQELLSWQQETGQQQQQQQQQQVAFDTIVVAAGAAIGSLAEFSQEQLPLSLCQGYTLEMEMVPPPDARSAAAACSTAASAPAAAAAAAGGATSSHYPAAAPSLLGAPYLASQGGARLLVGATKDHGWSSAQALAELGRCIDPAVVAAAAERQLQLTERQEQWPPAGDQTAAAGPAPASSAEVAEVAAATAELLVGAAAAWPPLARGWRIAAVRSGVRALPPRSQLGSVPLLGKWGELARPDGQEEEGRQQAPHGSGDARGHTTRQSLPVWLLVGLGARGLVYHAWLGQLTAAAVVSGSEAGLPHEVLGWRERPGP